MYATSPGAIFDPAVKPFAGNQPFTIDSIFIQGYYNRLNNAVTDTAIIAVYAKDSGNLSTLSGIANYFLLDYKQKVNKILADSAIAVYKIVLNNTFFNDTLLNGLHLFKVSSGITITGNHKGRVAVSIHFKPGKTYSQATDTLLSNSNSIRIVYSTPRGRNAIFSLAGGRDYSVGSFNDNNSLYGTFNHFLPPFSFIADHPYQFYDVNLKISQTNNYTAGINEQDNNAKLFQNFPNPTNGFTTVRYSLENQSQVTFEMMDVTGKKVMSIKEGNKIAGVHTIEINTDELNAGIYFYSVIVDGNRIAKKMTITK